MPTNMLRKSTRPATAGTSNAPAAARARDIMITAGRVKIRARLAATATADRLWAALPLFSTAETWGDSLHFETPIETGRERGAKINGAVGEIYFWVEDSRILIAFGPTPISRTSEIRLPRPCNVLATTTDDVAALQSVTPGEKVSVTVAPAAR